MFYSLAVCRNLTSEEADFITKVLTASKPEWVKAIPGLQVISKCCGCGKCTTVEFNESFTTYIDVSSYAAKIDSLNIVGITFYSNSKTPVGVELKLVR